MRQLMSSSSLVKGYDCNGLVLRFLVVFGCNYGTAQTFMVALSVAYKSHKYTNIHKTASAFKVYSSHLALEKDISSNYLVRHGLKFVLHLLKQCLHLVGREKN